LVDLTLSACPHFQETAANNLAVRNINLDAELEADLQRLKEEMRRQLQRLEEDPEDQSADE